MKLLLSIAKASERYLAQFNRIPLSDPDQHTVTYMVDDVVFSLKKQDRIQWALRYYIVRWIHKYSEDIKDWQKEISRLKLDPKELRDIRDQAPRVSIQAIVGNLKHWLSLNIPKINDYVFIKPDGSYPTVYEVYETFMYAEEEWKKKTAGKVKSDGDVVLKFPDGSAWFNLNKEYCEAEGQAMGHCGNRGNPQQGDKVLSYRTPNKDHTWSPHLTFILDKNNYLGEMKGRGNDKPSSKYHKQIIALLELPLIKGIKGGGYLPENNFSILDLDKSVRDQLLAKKPTLLTPTDGMEEALNNQADTGLREILLKQIKGAGNTIEKRKNHEYIRIGVFKTLQDFTEAFNLHVATAYLEEDLPNNIEAEYSSDHATYILERIREDDPALFNKLSLELDTDNIREMENRIKDYPEIEMEFTQAIYNGNVAGFMNSIFNTIERYYSSFLKKVEDPDYKYELWISWSELFKFFIQCTDDIEYDISFKDWLHSKQPLFNYLEQEVPVEELAEVLQIKDFNGEIDGDFDTKAAVQYLSDNYTSSLNE